jgi:murein L,D-transpeptidase YafK
MPVGIGEPAFIVMEFADLNLREYFQSFPQWEKWISRTIAASRTSGDYSIIIDKFSRKLILYHGGKKIKEYSAELGKNWVGNKRVKGDMATPEGMYKIVKKLDGNKTKYHKALLLNYPNNEDSARFKRDISNGSLPADSDIGGLIEIHGDGGKGADWTEGCVALTDKDIDSVFRYVRIGTPVTIVGSVNNLELVMGK